MQFDTELVSKAFRIMFIMGLFIYLFSNKVGVVSFQAGLQTRVGQWWESIPFLTSAVVVVCGVIYLVCLLIGYDSFYEICFLPTAVVSHFQGMFVR